MATTLTGNPFETQKRPENRHGTKARRALCQGHHPSKYFKYSQRRIKKAFDQVCRYYWSQEFPDAKIPQTEPNCTIHTREYNAIMRLECDRVQRQYARSDYANNNNY